ncbi:hypothetical protein FQR65_LT20594 [Abscondita terminalis]|nr:hypothetical protein FQR65_LT20594 [Abscondita terminalis]
MAAADCTERPHHLTDCEVPESRRRLCARAQIRLKIPAAYCSDPAGVAWQPLVAQVVAYETDPEPPGGKLVQTSTGHADDGAPPFPIAGSRHTYATNMPPWRKCLLPAQHRHREPGPRGDGRHGILWKTTCPFVADCRSHLLPTRHEEITHSS